MKVSQLVRLLRIVKALANVEDEIKAMKTGVLASVTLCTHAADATFEHRIEIGEGAIIDHVIKEKIKACEIVRLDLMHELMTLNVEFDDYPEDHDWRYERYTKGN